MNVFLKYVEKLYDQLDMNYFSKLKYFFIKNNFVFFITLAHSIIQAKQNECSQFSGIPTSCFIKFSIHIAHCSIIGTDEGVSGIGGSVGSEFLFFLSCSRCRARVVFVEREKNEVLKSFYICIYTHNTNTDILEDEKKKKLF